MLKATLGRESSTVRRRNRAKRYLGERDVAVQNTIEDELCLYKHNRALALYRKQSAITRALKLIAVALQNIAHFGAATGVDLTCPRCCQPLTEPCIVHPCGVTVCRACLKQSDEGLMEIAKMDCGCSSHGGYILNESIQKITQHLQETQIDSSVAELQYSLELLSMDFNKRAEVPVESSVQQRKSSALSAVHSGTFAPTSNSVEMWGSSEADAMVRKAKMRMARSSIVTLAVRR